MLVQTILAAKPTGGVIWMSPDTSVSDVAGLLSEKRIGAVVISTTGQDPTGILSERDIVREIGRRGAGVLSEPASALMTADPVTCGPDTRAGQVLEMMTAGRFRHMPVVQDGKMVGVVTIGDVIKARLDEISMEKDALEGMIMGH